MGGKRNAKGKRFYVYLASLTSVLLCSCAAITDFEKRHVAAEHLRRGEYFLIQEQFEQALSENEEVLSLTGQTPPADRALFAMGLIYAHNENPDMDYETAIEFFETLLAEFPQSPLTGQAKIWISVLNKLEKHKDQEIKKGKRRKVEKGKKRKVEKGEKRKVGKTKGQEEPLQPRTEIEIEKHLRLGNEYLAQKDFEQSLKQYQMVLLLSPRSSPGDKALFDMGLIFAHHDNPSRDYKTSLEFFTTLINEFPKSPLVDQSRVWVDVLQTIEKTKQVDIEIEEKKKELTR